MPLYRAILISTISRTVTVEALDIQEADDRFNAGQGRESEPENTDTPDVIFDIQEIPTDEEVEHYRQLHNADEVGINDQWNTKQARYYLELDDEWYEKRKTKV